MNFGSKKVYVYNQSDEESVSDDDVDYQAPVMNKRAVNYSARSMPMMQTDSFQCDSIDDDWDMDEIDSIDAIPPQRYQPAAAGAMGMQFDSIGSRAPPPAPAPAPQRRRQVRRADGNVFTVDVGKHAKPGDNIHVNTQRITCLSCQGVVTAFSSFQALAQANQHNWSCDFCNALDDNVDVTTWLKPTSDDVTFELEAPSASTAEQNMGENYNVVFVIDISGSMGQSTYSENRDPRTGRTTRCYVSRLEAVKTAALHQIKQIKDETPNVRVGFVTFGSEIFVYGDTTHQMVKFGENQIRNINQLKVLATDVHPLKPIKDTYDSLTAELSRIDVNGMTALGPALMASVAMAGNIKGSKVIICTDGQANVGVGTLPDDFAGEQRISDCRNTYTSFGQFAKDKGVSVSVISLEGTDCKLIHLGLVASMTGGVVDIVSLNNLDEQFGNILTSRTLATDVTVRLVLHHTMYIRTPGSTEQVSTRFENIGNVDEDTDMMVEFGVKTQTNDNVNPVTIAVEDDDQTDAEVYQVDTMPAAENRAENNLDNPPAAGDNQNNISDDDDQIDADVAAPADPTRQIPEVDAVPGAGNRATQNPAAAGENTPNITVEEAEVNQRQQREQVPDLSQLPFQTQITFTTRDGGKYLRVITNLQQTTRDREEAEDDMDMDVLGAVASKNVSKAMLAGQAEVARHEVKSKKKMAMRVVMKGKRSSSADAWNEDAEEYVQDLQELDGLVQQQQQPKISAAGYSRSMDTSYVTDSAPHQAVAQQQHAMSDSLAKELYERNSKGRKVYAAKKAARKK